MHGKIHVFQLSCTACSSFFAVTSVTATIAVQVAIAVFGFYLAGAENLFNSSSDKSGNRRCNRKGVQSHYAKS